MTSKFKALTDNTPPLSSGASTGAKAQPSKQSANSDNTPPSTPILRTQSSNMLSTVKNVSEKSRQHAAILRVVLSRLESDGLIRRFRVLSADRTTVKEVRIVFDLGLWTQELDLRVLSGETTGIPVTSTESK